MQNRQHGILEDILPKEEKTLEIVREKLAAGERVLIYTSWTRTDSQKKLLKQLHQEGICAEILKPSVPTEKRRNGWKSVSGSDYRYSSPIHP